MVLTEEQKKIFNQAAHKLGYSRWYFKQVWSLIAASADGEGTTEVDYRKIQSFADSFEATLRELERLDKRLIEALGESYAPSTVNIPSVKVRVLGTVDHFVGVPGSKENFRCDCGCNIFRKYEGTNTMKCNACPNEYEGEPIKAS